MKQTFKFLTLSRVFNDCRDTVGRLSTLFLLLIALSFGFNQEVKAKTVYIDVSWNTNYADKMMVHYWGGANNKFVWASKCSDSWNYMYQATIDDDATTWQVCRGDGTGSSDSKYNYQNNVDLPNNKYKVNDWNNKGEASKTVGIVTGGGLYFDNSITNWTNNSKQFVIGNTISKCYKMSHVSGTELWAVSPSDKWPDATYYAFVGNGSDWDNGNWGKDNIKNANKYTAVYEDGYSLDNGSTYLVEPSSADNNAPFTITYKGGSHTDLPKYTHTLKVYTRTSVDGSTPTYTQSVNSPTSVTMTGKKMKGFGESEDATATVTTSLKTKTVADIVTTSTLSGSYTALANGSAWVFDGWSTGGTSPTATTSTYSITKAKEAKTMNAYFTLRQFSVSYGVNGGNGSIKLNSGSAVTTSSSTNVNYGSNITFTATPNTGYVVEGWYSDSEGNTKIDAAGTETTYSINNVTAAKTVYVKFKAQTYAVTFGVYSTEPMHGTLGAKVGGADITSVADVQAGATVNFTATPATGYEVEGWYSNDGCTQAIAGTSTSTTYNTTISAATIVYVKFKAKQFIITYKDQGNTTFSGTHQSGYPQKHTYDQVTTLDSPTKTGYEFQGWHKLSNCSDDAVTTIGAKEITDNITLYAKWQINNYNISHTQGEHYTMTDLVKNADYNSEVSFTATPAKGYLLTVTATKGGNSVSLTKNGNTYTIAHMPDGDVTISVVANPYQLQGNFINHGGSFDDTKYDFDNNFQYKITLNATTDYTFKLRNESATGHYLGNSGAITSTITEPWDFSTSVNNSCTIKTGVAGTYIFTYTEKNDGTPQILVTYPEGNMVVVDMSGSEKRTLALTRVGDKWVSESITLAQNKSYTFQLFYEGAAYGANYTMNQAYHTNVSMSTTERNKPWLNTENTDHSAGAYFFEFDANTKKLSAVYPSFFKCSALDDWEHKPITFENNVKTVEIVSDGKSDFEFLFINDGLYYGKNDNTTIDRSTSFTLTNSDWKNVIVKATKGGAGTYTIMFNQSTKFCQVTFPDNTKYDVTVYLDGKTRTTTQAGPAGGIGIRAVDKPGYRFKEWVISGTAGAARVAETNQQSTTLYCDAAGGVVTATYENSEFIYFKNIPGWSNVNVYFYNEDYFDKDNGSGALADEKEEKRKCYGWAMTHIPNTDIWYLDYKSMGRKPDIGIVAFSDHLQNDNQWFYECQVAYRKDFSTCTPMYMPVNWIHERLCGGKTAYYEQGCWMKFDDVQSGYEVKLFDKITDGGTEKAHVDLIADNAGGYTFTGTININFGDISQAAYNYGFKIKNKCNETYFGNNGTMTSTNCTNWEFNSASDMKNCGLTTTIKGNYTFTISFDGGIMHVSVEYPVDNGDYRVVYKEGSNEPIWNGFYYKKSATDRKDTASFFIKNGVNATVELQRGKDLTANPAVWEKVQEISTSELATGVYNFEVSQTNEGANATIENKGIYSGDFYIRTDGVDGGWKAYATNSDNKMTGYGSLLDAGATYENFQYDYFKTKWIDNGKNVKFCIANDYSKNISSEFTTDATLGGDAQALPQEANVRFMWNSTNNQLSRAYISGSSKISDRFLVLMGDDKMFNANGDTLTEGKGKIAGLNDYELNFADKNNWVYQADIKAKPGCAVKLTAKYNNQVQYFIGAAGEGTGSRKTIIAGNGETQYTMRVVYDFKTNLLIAGWVPDGKEITDTIKLGGDMLITRTHQDSAQQIIFGTTGSIEDIHHIYGVLSIKKDTMLGKGIGDAKYKTVATNADYDRTMYWISFPFKVKISEIFGVDGYGTKWIMQKYRGDLRAQKGWFKEDTPTFWEYMDIKDSLNAYEGYLFLLDANYFNKESADVWKNSATEANFYFPSASGNIGIINQSSFTQEVPENKCGIDRTFNVQGVGEVNHMNTDSYWNVIGVPAFQNKSMALSNEEVDTKMNAIYEWNSNDNTYTPRALQDQFRFQTMHAYMVQFGGDITWSDVSVVNNPTPAQGGSAPRYAYADTKNYFIKLFFGNGEAEDHAYINLADEASTDFVLNEDMMKLDNAGYPNIYSFAGNYNVAYNETKMTNQSITIGVSAPKDGSYTFSMPKDFSGSAILVDLEEGTYTDLNVSNYSVDLNKGTYNNRFQLMLEVEAKTPTNIQNANGGLWSEDGKTQKLLINDQIYLINGGRVYNATGVQLR